jgi:YegS/Rv2252/BmrU family lipid kinase
MADTHTGLDTLPSFASRTTLHPRALVLLNRGARLVSSRARIAVDHLRQAGFDLTEVEAEHANQLSPIIREYRDRVDLVVVAGGDGTMFQAADGLFDTQLPLGIIPTGTANDLARTLALPLDPVQAAEVILAGNQKRIDLGLLNGTHFFNVANIGLAIGITRRLSHQKKSRWGIFAYLFSALQTIFRARPFRAEIRTSHQTVPVRTVQITVGNGRHYGGGMIVDEQAQIDDGTLHLFSLEVDHWWQLLPLIPDLRLGTLRGLRHVRTLQGKEFEIHLLKKRPRHVMADGEIAGRTPATIRVVPEAISVFVPASRKQGI